MFILIVHHRELIDKLDGFSAILNYFFDSTSLKLAFIAAVINLLKHLITVTSDTPITRGKILLEAIFVGVVMYGVTPALIDNKIALHYLYLIAISLGVLGYSIIERLLKTFSEHFIENKTHLNIKIQDETKTESANKKFTSRDLSSPSTTIQDTGKDETNNTKKDL